jgi:hypothetical protein
MEFSSRAVAFLKDARLEHNSEAGGEESGLSPAYTYIAARADNTSAPHPRQKKIPPLSYASVGMTESNRTFVAQRWELEFRNKGRAAHSNGLQPGTPEAACLCAPGAS